MKKLILILALVLLTSPAFAARPRRTVIINNNTTVNNTTVVNGKTSSNEEDFDYGAYLDLIAFETPKTEWGIKTTWLQESQEARIYVGGKIYLNRIVKK